MIQKVKLKRGLDLAMSGAAAAEIGSLNRPTVFSVVPDHFNGIKPKVVVREGDRVKVGTALFHDKEHEAMNFVSPVSGKVLGVNRGERRKVMSITIEADATNEYEVFTIPATLTQEAVKTLLLQSGLWMLVKQRPYDVIADPTKQPRAIFISSFDSAPLAPDYGFVLKGKTAQLQAGINALATQTEGKIYVGLKAGMKSAELSGLKNVEFVEFDGPHPAGNVGVQINHIAPVNKGEVVWTINVQDLALIGQLFLTGKVTLERLVALTGPMVIAPKYYRYTYGMPISTVVNGNVHKEVNLRYVAGNVLSGHQIATDEVMEPYQNQITVIEEGDHANEFMGWMMPRFDKFSSNGAFFTKYFESCFRRSFFGKKEYQYDARLLGGRRAIIVSGEYDKVFPMDIYPEYLIKAMIAGNLDKMEQLGAYEVAPEDFALCEYVCTSKMPLQAIVRQSLDNMRKELE